MKKFIFLVALASMLSSCNKTTGAESTNERIQQSQGEEFFEVGASYVVNCPPALIKFKVDRVTSECVYGAIVDKDEILDVNPYTKVGEKVMIQKHNIVMAIRSK